MSLKRHNFTKRNSCQRFTNPGTKRKTNKHFDEAIISTQMFEEFIRGEYDPGSVEEIRDEVAISYSEQNIDDITETQEASVKTLSKCMFRFINSWNLGYGEDSFCFVPDDAIYLDLTDWIDQKDGTHFEGEEDIAVTFNCIHDSSVADQQTNGVCGTIEGITLRKGRPTIGKTAKSADNALNDIWLHMQRLALRKYANAQLNPGNTVTIKSSYYFLRKTKDKSGDSYELDDYFKDDDGIRQLVETYTVPKDGEVFPDTEYDTMLRALLEKYAVGYDKCELREEKDCVGCPEYLSCYFKEPPKAINTGESSGIKARGSIERDSYQEAVVQFRSGTGVVDAPPGSGKTEVTTERTVMMAFEMLEDLVTKYESGEEIEVPPITADFKCIDSKGILDDKEYRVEFANNEIASVEQGWDTEEEELETEEEDKAENESDFNIDSYEWV